MSNKIRIYKETGSNETEELPSVTTRILLPNGTEFTFKYNHVYGGLEIIKAYAEEDGAVQIQPLTSNHVILK